MFYKNTSYFVKTFYGVTFKPGETKEVADYINHPFMVRVDGPAIQITDKPQKKPSSVLKRANKSESEQPKIVEVVATSDELIADSESTKNKN